MNASLLAVVLGLQALTQAGSPSTQGTELPPSPEQVMAIPDDLRTAFQKDVLDGTRFPEARLQKLVAFIFDSNKLGVQYHANATQTVAESFHSRKVNCLSSTLLVVALARAAGLQAEGQELQRILAWNSVGETVVQSRHANAIIKVAEKRKFVVDVDSSDVLATDALQPISDEKLLASFYGNRAMELLVEGRLNEAEAWLGAALRQAPEDAVLWNNAGVLSRRMGDMTMAEQSFLRAWAKDPGQMSALSNLVALYRARGDTAQAATWHARAERTLRKDPYYQFSLGRQQEQSGNYSEAIAHYRRAVSLKPDEHRFHFGLGRMYFTLGKLRMADRELSLAEDLSNGSLREKYQDKLAALRQMRRAPSLN